MKEVFIEKMDAFAYRERIANDDPVILIPVGTVEQHGPHMPLSVDQLLPKKMSELVAKKLDLLVGPTINLGYKSQQRSGGGNHIVGSFGLDAETLIGTIKTLVKELHRHGFSKITFVNGHYENYQFMYEGTDLAVREITEAGRKPPTVMLLSYWDFVTEEAINKIYPGGFPGWDIEHGGILETALMLEYYPELVNMDRVMDLPAAVLPPYDILPVRPEITPESGCLSSAKPATAEKGRILAKSVVSGMSKAINEGFNLNL